MESEDITALAEALHTMRRRGLTPPNTPLSSALARELLPILNEKGWFLVSREQLDGALSADGEPL